MSKKIQETKLINVIIHDLQTYEVDAKVFTISITGQNFSTKVSVPAKTHDTLPIAIQSEPIIVSVPHNINLNYEVSVINNNNKIAENFNSITKNISTIIPSPNNLVIRANPSSFELTPSYPDPNIDIATYEFYVLVDNLRYPAELESILTTTTPPTHKSLSDNMLVLPCRPDDSIRVWCRAVDTAGHISSWYPNTTEGITSTAPRSYIEGDSPSVVAMFDYMVYGETPAGDIDGENTMFEPAYPIACTNGAPKATLTLNGIRLNHGTNNDFTYDEIRNVLSLNITPVSGDILIIDYLRSVSNT